MTSFNHYVKYHSFWLFPKVVDKSSLLKVLKMAEDQLGIPRAILRSARHVMLIILYLIPVNQKYATYTTFQRF